MEVAALCHVSPAEWREACVRRRLGREWRETERRVLAEHQHGDGTS
jgi:hypothetical protein